MILEQELNREILMKAIIKLQIYPKKEVTLQNEEPTTEYKYLYNVADTWLVNPIVKQT